MESTRLLTDCEAADLLGLTARQVLRMANRGELPAVRFPNRQVRFDPADLARFIKTHTVQPVAKRPPSAQEARP